jgi:hypothetical protein
LVEGKPLYSGRTLDDDDDDDLWYRFFLLFLSMGWHYVSELQSPKTLLFIPGWCSYVSEARWNDNDRGELKTRRGSCPSVSVSTKNPSWN